MSKKRSYPPIVRFAGVAWVLALLMLLIFAMNKDASRSEARMAHLSQ